MKSNVVFFALSAVCAILGCNRQNLENESIAKEKPMWTYQTESKVSANEQSNPRMSDIYTQMMMNGEKIDGVTITSEFIQRLKALEGAWDMVGGTNAYNELCNKLLPYKIAFFESHSDESLNELVRFHNDHNLPIVAGETLLSNEKDIKEYYSTYFTQIDQKDIDYLKGILNKLQTASK